MVEITNDLASGIMGKLQSPNARLAFMLLEKYINGAKIQHDRIQIDKCKLTEGSPGINQNDMERLFLDIHCYFICCDKAQNIIEYLVKKENDQELNALWDTYKPRFKPFNDARNHLEHIETRIEEKYLSDFGNLKDETYTFGGVEFDISSSGLKIFTDAFEKIISILDSRS